MTTDDQQRLGMSRDDWNDYRSLRMTQMAKVTNDDKQRLGMSKED